MQAQSLRSESSASIDSDQFFDALETESNSCRSSLNLSYELSRENTSQNTRSPFQQKDDKSLPNRFSRLDLKEDSSISSKNSLIKNKEEKEIVYESSVEDTNDEIIRNQPSPQDRNSFGSKIPNDLMLEISSSSEGEDSDTDLSRPIPVAVALPPTPTPNRFQLTQNTVVDRDTGRIYTLNEAEGLDDSKYARLPNRGVRAWSEQDFKVDENDVPEGASHVDDQETKSNQSSSTGSLSRKTLIAGLKSLGGKGRRTQIKFPWKKSQSKDSGMSSRKSESAVARGEMDPRILELTGLVQIKLKNKTTPEFSDMALLQQVSGHRGAIWTLAFSPDGGLLATGGQDTYLLVWRISRESARISRNLNAAGQQFKGEPDLHHTSAFSRATQAPPVDRETLERGVESERHPGEDEGMEFCDALFLEVPIRKYAGHSADIIDVSWSRTDFLLSASIDKSVKLWHATREECLHTFPHSDFVTGVDFHPIQDKFFISGCFDKKIRLWNIPDGRVKEWTQASDIVTATKFSPDGSFVIAGLYHGQVIFYQTDGLRYYTQIECRNRKGPLKTGQKVTGLAFMNSGLSEPVPNSVCRVAASCHHQLLVTTNDSRLRLYTDDYLMACKYKGLLNDSMQIKASFSEENEYVICGSENGKVYIWKAYQANAKHSTTGHRDKNNSYESFLGSGGDPAIATVAQFVHSRSVRHALKKKVCMDSEMPNADYVNAMIITADYNGTIRVYCRAKYKR